MQIVFSKVFPNYYLQNDNISIQYKTIFDITYKNWLKRKDLIIIKEEEKEEE